MVSRQSWWTFWCGIFVCVTATTVWADEAPEDIPARSNSRIRYAIYQRDWDAPKQLSARLISHPPGGSMIYHTSPYSSQYQSHYGDHDAYDTSSQRSYYSPRAYDYTSRYPFAATPTPSYRYPYSRDYYSYGPSYSQYGYAFGYPYGYYGGFPGGWGGAYFGPVPYWGW